MKHHSIILKKTDDILLLLGQEKNAHIKLRLIFLNVVAHTEINLEKACSLFGITTAIGRLWIRQWNDDAYEGIRAMQQFPIGLDSPC